MKLPVPELQQTQVPSFANFKAVLRNNFKERSVWVDAVVSGLVAERVLKNLSQHEQRALNFVAQYESVSVSEVQWLTGRTWPYAKKLLVGLVEKEALDHKIRIKLDRDPQARFVLSKGGLIA